MRAKRADYHGKIVLYLNVIQRIKMLNRTDSVILHAFAIFRVVQGRRLIYHGNGLSPMTKAPSPTEKSKKQHDNKKATKNLNYSTTADRLKTVSWNNNSHPDGVGNPVYERSTLPLTATAVL